MAIFAGYQFYLLTGRFFQNNSGNQVWKMTFKIRLSAGFYMHYNLSEYINKYLR